MVVFLAIKNWKPKIVAYFDTEMEADQWWLKHRPKDTRRIIMETAPKPKKPLMDKGE